MEKKIYLIAKRNAYVNKKNVTIEDLADVFCKEKSVQDSVLHIQTFVLDKNKSRRISMSVMRIIKLINYYYPDYEIENMGETDIIIEYKEKKKSGVIQVLKIIISSLLIFTGSAYAIMAYNNDVGMQEIFKKIYEMFGIDHLSSGNILEITYGIGLSAGIIIFYNHFGGIRFSGEPTPLEVEMNKYEKDITDTVSDVGSSKGREIK